MTRRFSTCLTSVFLTLIALTMTACASLGVERPEINSVSDSIIVTATDIRSAAEAVAALCGHEVPGGDCAPGALIDSATRDRLRERLQDGLDIVASANRLLAAGESVEAGSTLARAEAILLAVQAELQRRQR